MADVSKLKKLKGRSNELGVPPTPDQVSVGLAIPEIIPDPSVTAVPLLVKAPVERIDRRSIRRTNRTMQFATRVTPEWNARIRALAQKEGSLLVEILEKALDQYENLAAR